MDEKTTHDGRTAMERLARELMDKIESNAATSWCREHGYNVKGTSYTEDKRNARADIERRINEADLEDDRARDSALGDWKAKADAMDETCRVLGVDSYNLAADAARSLAEEHCELKELREAGRVMPEGVSWPRYEDGEPVRMGDPFVTWDGLASEVRSVTLCTPGPDAAWTINAGSCRNFVGGSDEAHRMHGLRLKLPAPKALGADGVEIKAGDTVWLAPEWRCSAGVTSVEDKFRLDLVDADKELRVCGVEFGCGEPRATFGHVTSDLATIHEMYCPASWLTHERPDSWERLREDARKLYTAYWGCIGHSCARCPASVDGINPAVRYSTANCHDAMGLDLVARAERLAGVEL